VWLHDECQIVYVHDYTYTVRVCQTVYVYVCEIV